MKHLWNFISKIKNAQLTKKTISINKRNKFCENFLKLLWHKKFILGYFLGYFFGLFLWWWTVPLYAHHFVHCFD